MVVHPSPEIKSMYVVANPHSGTHASTPDTIKELLEKTNLDWEILLTEKGRDAQILARQAAKAGADVVAAYGGDGTVMAVADGLRGTNVPLAILPGGTANVMAVELGIPRDVSQAMALINDGPNQIRIVDMGLINDKCFMLRVGIGWEAEITTAADPEIKARFGSLAYMQSALKSMGELQPVQYRLVVDSGEPIEIEGISCSICNSGNLGVPGLGLAPNISIGDGMLDVVIIRNRDLASILSLIGSVVQSVLHPSEAYEPLPHWQAHEITLTANPPQTVTYDGEVLDYPFPITIKVMPQAIRVIVPGEIK